MRKRRPSLAALMAVVLAFPWQALAVPLNPRLMQASQAAGFARELDRILVELDRRLRRAQGPRGQAEEGSPSGPAVPPGQDAPAEPEEREADEEEPPSDQRLLAEFEGRLARLQDRVQAEVTDHEERERLLGRIRQVLSILGKLKRLAAKTRRDGITARMVRLLQAAGTQQDPARLAQFEATVDRLIRIAELPEGELGQAQAQEELGQLFENWRGSFSGNESALVQVEEVRAAFSSAPGPADGTYPSPSPFHGFHAGALPAPAGAEGERRERPGLLALLGDAFRLGLHALADPSPAPPPGLAATAAPLPVTPSVRAAARAIRLTPGPERASAGELSGRVERASLDMLAGVRDVLAERLDAERADAPGAAERRTRLRKLDRVLADVGQGRRTAVDALRALTDPASLDHDPGFAELYARAMRGAAQGEQASEDVLAAALSAPQSAAAFERARDAAMLRADRVAAILSRFESGQLDFDSMASELRGLGLEPPAPDAGLRGAWDSFFQDLQKALLERRAVDPDVWERFLDTIERLRTGGFINARSFSDFYDAGAGARETWIRSHRVEERLRLLRAVRRILSDWRPGTSPAAKDAAALDAFFGDRPGAGEGHWSRWDEDRRQEALDRVAGAITDIEEFLRKARDSRLLASASPADAEIDSFRESFFRAMRASGQLVFDRREFAPDPASQWLDVPEAFRLRLAAASRFLQGQALTAVDEANLPQQVRQALRGSNLPPGSYHRDLLFTNAERFNETDALGRFLMRIHALDGSLRPEIKGQLLVAAGANAPGANPTLADVQRWVEEQERRRRDSRTAGLPRGFARLTRFLRAHEQDLARGFLEDFQASFPERFFASLRGAGMDSQLDALAAARRTQRETLTSLSARRGPGLALAASRLEQARAEQARHPATHAAVALAGGALAAAALSANSAQAAFRERRAEERERLWQGAQAALREAGFEPSDFGDLNAADPQLVRLRAALLGDAGISPAAGNDALQRRQASHLRTVAPSLAAYFARRGLYQIAMHQGLSDGAVAEGTRFAPWELGIDAPNLRAVAFITVQEDGRAFLGLKQEYEDGSWRFEGRAEGRSLLAMRSPSDNREVRTVVEHDEAGTAQRMRTRVINTQTGRSVRAELANLLVAMTTFTDFGDDGEAVRIETLDTSSGTATAGTRTLEDRRRQTLTRVSPSGAVTITPLRSNGEWTEQRGVLDPEGRFVLQRLTQPGGNVLHFISPHVIRITDGSDRLRGWEVRVDRFSDPALRGRAREDHAWAVAREVIRALGLNDRNDQHSRPLHNFLWDIDRRGDGFTGVRLNITPEKHFNLIYARREGGSYVSQARFERSTPYDDATEQALIVLQGVSVDARGRGTGGGGRFREYPASGGYRQWRRSVGTRERGAFASIFCAIENYENIYLDNFRWQGNSATGYWAPSGSELKQTNTSEVPNSSYLGIIGHGIYEAPVIGHILQGGEWVGMTLYTGIVAGGHEIIFAITGDDVYGRHAAGGYASNPAMVAAMGRDEILARVRAYPGQWSQVEGRALMNRQAYLRQHPEIQNAERTAFLRRPFTTDELWDALRAEGASRGGAQLIEIASQEQGAGRYLWGAAGYALRTGEGVAQGMLNPVVWATFGLGRAVQALQGLNAAGTGLRFLPAAMVPTTLRVATITHEMLFWSFGGVMALGAADHVGRVAQAASRGDFERTLMSAADATTDILFLASLAESRVRAAQARARARIAARETALREQLRAAEEASRGAGPEGPGNPPPLPPPMDPVPRGPPRGGPMPTVVDAQPRGGAAGDGAVALETQPRIRGGGDGAVALETQPRIRGGGDGAVALETQPRIRGGGDGAVALETQPRVRGGGDGAVALETQPRVRGGGDGAVALETQPRVRGGGDGAVALETQPRVRGSGDGAVALETQPRIRVGGDGTVALEARPRGRVGTDGAGLLEGELRPRASSGGLDLTELASRSWRAITEPLEGLAERLRGRGTRSPLDAPAPDGQPRIRGGGDTAVALETQPRIRGGGDGAIALETQPRIRGGGDGAMALETQPRVRGGGDGAVALETQPRIRGGGDGAVALETQPRIRGGGDGAVALETQPRIRGGGDGAVALETQPRVRGGGDGTVTLETQPRIRGGGDGAVALETQPRIRGGGDGAVALETQPRIRGGGDGAVALETQPRIRGGGDATVALETQPRARVGTDGAALMEGELRPRGSGGALDLMELASRSWRSITEPFEGLAERLRTRGQGPLDAPILDGQPRIRGGGDTAVALETQPRVRGGGDGAVALETQPRIRGGGDGALALETQPRIRGGGDGAVALETQPRIRGGGDTTVALETQPRSRVGTDGAGLMEGELRPRSSGGTLDLMELASRSWRSITEPLEGLAERLRTRGQGPLDAPAPDGQPRIRGGGDTAVALETQPRIRGGGDGALALETQPRIRGGGDGAVALETQPRIRGGGDSAVALETQPRVRVGTDGAALLEGDLRPRGSNTGLNLMELASRSWRSIAEPFEGLAERLRTRGQGVRGGGNTAVALETQPRTRAAVATAVALVAQPRTQTGSGAFVALVTQPQTAPAAEPGVDLQTQPRAEPAPVGWPVPATVPNPRTPASSPAPGTALVQAAPRTDPLADEEPQPELQTSPRLAGGSGGNALAGVAAPAGGDDGPPPGSPRTRRPAPLAPPGPFVASLPPAARPPGSDTTVTPGPGESRPDPQDNPAARTESKPTSPSRPAAPGRGGGPGGSPPSSGGSGNRGGSGGGPGGGGSSAPPSGSGGASPAGPGAPSPGSQGSAGPSGGAGPGAGAGPGGSVPGMEGGGAGGGGGGGKGGGSGAGAGGNGGPQGGAAAQAPAPAAHGEPSVVAQPGQNPVPGRTTPQSDPAPQGAPGLASAAPGFSPRAQSQDIPFSPGSDPVRDAPAGGTAAPAPAGRGEWNYAPPPFQKGIRFARKRSLSPRGRRPPTPASVPEAGLPVQASAGPADCSQSGRCPPMALNLFNQEYEKPSRRGRWWSLLLALLALAAWVCLYNYSELPYALGMRRREPR